jgi:hypothetical protein
VKDKIRGKCLFWTNAVWSDFAEIQIQWDLQLLKSQWSSKVLELWMCGAFYPTTKKKPRGNRIKE